MRFLLRVDSHARNHSAHPQAQSRVAALRAYPCSDALRACSAAPTARSARVSGRYIPILRSSKRSSAVTQPPGSCAVSARTSLSCLIVRLCSCIRSICSAVGRSGLRHLLPVHTVTTVFSSSGRTHVALAASSFCFVHCLLCGMLRHRPVTSVPGPSPAMRSPPQSLQLYFDVLCLRCRRDATSGCVEHRLLHGGRGRLDRAAQHLCWSDHRGQLKAIRTQKKKSEGTAHYPPSSLHCTHTNTNMHMHTHAQAHAHAPSRRRTLHQPCAQELGRTAFTTTTGHVHRGAALELRCSRVWSCRGRRQRHSVCQTRATTSGQLRSRRVATTGCNRLSSCV